MLFDGQKTSFSKINLRLQKKTFRYATETNRLIVRLDKLLDQLPGVASVVINKVWWKNVHWECVKFYHTLDLAWQLTTSACFEGEASKRREQERQVVPWIDEDLVKLCPSCARSFNIARRKHHCRYLNFTIKIEEWSALCKFGLEFTKFIKKKLKT